MGQRECVPSWKDYGMSRRTSRGRSSNDKVRRLKSETSSYLHAQASRPARD